MIRHPFVLACAMAFLAIAVRAQLAPTIISRNVDIKQINGFLMQNDTTTMRIAPGTYYYTLTNSNGTVSNVSVVADRVIRYYATGDAGSFVWAIPQDVTLMQCDSCLTQNPYQYNGTEQSTNGFVQSPPPVEFNQTGEIGRALTGGYGDVASVLSTIACSYANSATYGIVSAFGGPCSTGGNGITADQFAAFGNSVADQFSNILDLLGGLQAWQSTANNQYEFIIDAFGNVQAAQQASIYALGNLTRAVGNTQSQVNNIMTESTAGFAVIQKQLIATNTNAKNLTEVFIQYQNVTQTVLADILLKQAQNNEALTSQMNSLTDTVNEMARNNQMKFLTTQSAINTLSAVALSQATQSAFLPGLTAKWRIQKARLASLNIGSKNYKPMVDSIGAPGVADLNNIPEGLRTRQMDVPQIRYILNNGNLTGNPAPPFRRALAVTSQLNYVCSTPYLSLNSQPINTWTEWSNTLGPVPCNTTGGTALCDCWVEVQEQYCNMPQTFGGFGFPTIGAIANWTLWDDPLFPPKTSPYYFCDGGAISTLEPIPGLANMTIRSFADWTIFVGVMTRRGINLGPGAPTGYTTYSPLVRKKGTVPYSAVPGLIPYKSLDLMNPNSTARPTLPYLLIMGFFIPSVQLASTASYNISQSLYGGMPTNSTILTEEYTQTAGLSLGICKSMYVVAYDVSQFVSLYRYRRVATTKNVAVYVNGALYSVISDGIVTNPFEEFAIPSGSYIAGIPGQQWRTSLYDIAYSQNVPNFNPQGRAGSPWYGAYPTIGVPTAANYNLSNWRRYNINPFNHLAAASSIAKFRNTLICDFIFNPPRCLCNTTSAGVGNNGNLCDMMTYFEVATPISIGGASMALVSRFDEVLVTVSIPTGTLVATSGSICPTVTPIQTQEFSQVTLKLYNSIATNNFVVVTESGACSKRRELNLSPLQTVVYTVQYCPIQDPNVPIAVQFYYLPPQNGADPPVLTLCNTTYPITITPTNPPSTSGLNGASFTTTEILRSETTNTALLNIQALQASTINLAQDLVIAFVQTVYLNRMVLSNDTSNPLGAFGPLNNRLTQIARDTADALNVSRTTVFSYSNETIDFSRQNAILLNVTLQNIADSQTSVDNLAGDISNQQENLLVLYELTARNEEFLNKSRNSLEFLVNVLNTIVEEARRNGFQGSFFDLLRPIGDFLIGIGQFGSSLAKDAVGFLKDAAGSFADSMKGMFTSMGSMFSSLIVYGLIGVAVFLAFYCMFKQGVCDTSLKEVKKSEIDMMIARIKKLEAVAGLSGASVGIAVAEASPPVAPVNPKRTGGKKKKNEREDRVMRALHEMSITSSS